MLFLLFLVSLTNVVPLEEFLNYSHEVNPDFPMLDISKDLVHNVTVEDTGLIKYDDLDESILDVEDIPEIPPDGDEYILQQRVPLSFFGTSQIRYSYPEILPIETPPSFTELDDFDESLDKPPEDIPTVVIDKSFPNLHFNREVSKGRFIVKSKDGLIVYEGDLDALIKKYPSSDVYLDTPISVMLLDSLNLTGANLLHDDGIEGSVGICILDTGVNGSVVDSVSFVDGEDYFDYNGHGTLMAQIVKSYAPGSNIVNVKVMNSDGTGYSSSVLQGINWCVSHKDDYNIKVILMAFGGGEFKGYCLDDVLYDSVNSAYASGISLVAPMGNDGRDIIPSPACIPNVTAVGSSSKSDEISSFSNVREEMDLLAPGESIVVNNQSYSGTSLSSATVAGSYALFYDYNNSLTPRDIEALFRGTGKNISGYPRIDLISARDSPEYLYRNYSTYDSGTSSNYSVKATYITSCTTISSPGTYILANDLVGVQSGRSYCIRIASSSVTLDCDGRTIRNDDTSSTRYGIYLYTSNDMGRITVRGCNVVDYSRGIYFYTSGLLEDVTLEKNIVDLPTSSLYTLGIYLRGNYMSTIDVLSNEVRDGYSTSSSIIGIYVYPYRNSKGINIEENTISNLLSYYSSTGIRAYSYYGPFSEYDYVRDNSIDRITSQNSYSYGIYFMSYAHSPVSFNIIGNSISNIYSGTSNDYAHGIYARTYYSDFLNFRLNDNSISNIVSRSYIARGINLEGSYGINESQIESNSINGVYSQDRNALGYRFSFTKNITDVSISGTVANILPQGSVGSGYGLRLYARDSFVNVHVHDLDVSNVNGNGTSAAYGVHIYNYNGTSINTSFISSSISHVYSFNGSSYGIYVASTYYNRETENFNISSVAIDDVYGGVYRDNAYGIYFTANHYAYPRAVSISRVNLTNIFSNSTYASIGVRFLISNNSLYCGNIDVDHLRIYNLSALDSSVRGIYVYLNNLANFTTNHLDFDWFRPGPTSDSAVGIYFTLSGDVYNLGIGGLRCSDFYSSSSTSAGFYATLGSSTTSLSNISISDSYCRSVWGRNGYGYYLSSSSSTPLSNVQFRNVSISYFGTNDRGNMQGIYLYSNGGIVDGIIDGGEFSNGYGNSYTYNGAVYAYFGSHADDLEVSSLLINNLTTNIYPTYGVVVRSTSTATGNSIFILNNTITDLNNINSSHGTIGIFTLMHDPIVINISGNSLYDLGNVGYIYGIRTSNTYDIIKNVYISNNSIGYLHSDDSRVAGIMTSSWSSTYGKIYNISVVNNSFYNYLSGSSYDYSMALHVYGYLGVEDYLVNNNLVWNLTTPNYYSYTIYVTGYSDGKNINVSNNQVWDIYGASSYNMYVLDMNFYNSSSHLTSINIINNSIRNIFPQPNRIPYLLYLRGINYWQYVNVSFNSLSNVDVQSTSSFYPVYVYSSRSINHSSFDDNYFYNLTTDGTLDALLFYPSNSYSVTNLTFNNNSFDSLFSSGGTFIGIYFRSLDASNLEFSINLSKIGAYNIYGAYVVPRGSVSNVDLNWLYLWKLKADNYISGYYVRVPSGEYISYFDLRNFMINLVTGSVAYLVDFYSDYYIDVLTLENISVNHVEGSSNAALITANTDGKLTRVAVSDVTANNMQSGGLTPVLYFRGTTSCARLRVDNFTAINISGDTYALGVSVTSDYMDSIDLTNIQALNFDSSNGYSEAIYLNGQSGDSLYIDTVNGSRFAADDVYGGCMYAYFGDVLTNGDFYNINCSSGKRMIYLGGISPAFGQNWILWNSTEYAMYLENTVNNSNFNDIFIYNTSKYLRYSSTATPSNHFNDLTLGYDDSFGLINWSSVDIDFVIANSSYLLLDPYFVSLDAWEFNIVQLNADANITLKSEGCPYGVYRDVDFPQSREEIIRDGSIVNPVYKSCSPPYGIFSTVNQFDSAAGYAIYSCFTINESGEYSLLASMMGNKTDGACITINASDVILNCSGLNLTGLYDGSTGVRVEHSDNVKVFNCTILNYTKGLHYNVSDDGWAYNNTIFNCSQGILSYFGQENNFTNSTLFNNEMCVSLNSTETPRAERLELWNCGIGVFAGGLGPVLNSITIYDSGVGVLSDADNVFLTNSSITNCSQVGVNLTGSSASLLENNICFNLLDLSNSTLSATGSLDRCYYWNNWWENDHKGCEFSCFDVWHVFFGHRMGYLKLADQNTLMMEWMATGGYVYAVSSSDSPVWTSLLALGRTASNTLSSNDFSEADQLLGTSGAWDSIENTFSSDGSTPLRTVDIYFLNHSISNLPVVNTTNNSERWTGILWDSSMDSNGEFDTTDAESLVFVANVTSSSVDCKYGSCTFEIRIPGTFDTYRGDPNGVVYFYTELK